MPFTAISAVALVAAAASIPSSPDLGKVDADCRPDERGPSLFIDAEGLKDREGTLKLEVYPANDRDFLQDDNILVSEGKTFRRVEVPVTGSNPQRLCIRVPEPGRYAVSLLHDRDSNRRFSIIVDGIGFGGNPDLKWRKPKASEASLHVGNRPSHHRILLNYHRGFLSFGPLQER